MKRMLALVGVLALGLTATRAQTDGALLDALVKKGVLSDQEAEDIRASEASDYATTPAGKIVLSDSVKQIKFYGDVRYRWEYADEKAQNNFATPTGAGVGAGDNIVERSRFRLRVGTDITFSDKFTGGIELETNTANDSANQTFGNAYNKYAINVGLAYLQWKPTDWLTIVGGKQHNPLYTTDLVWDPDINPEGGSEALSWTFPIGGDSAPASAPASTDAKDMKSVAPVSESAPSEMSLTIGLTAFQGIYADNSEFTNPVAPTTDRTDVWQFVEQVPIQFNFNKKVFIKEVPGFDTYTSGGTTGPGVTGSGGGSENFTAYNNADDLAIFTAPGEFDFPLTEKIPAKLYWDFALNLDGKNRIQDVYLAQTPGTALTAGQNATQSQNQNLGDNVAWEAGVQVGQNKKKGDWSIKADYRQVGLGAVDPNLNDSDWADSFLNQQGVRVQSIYNFTDFLTGSITVYDTWAYKSALLNGSFGNNPSGLPIVTGVTGTTASGITNLAGANQTQRVQVDLMWKF
jgi:hypothetical protein